MNKKIFLLFIIILILISGIYFVFKSEYPEEKINERKYKPDTIFFINNPPYAYKVRVEHWEYYTKTEEGLERHTYEKNIPLYISGTLKYMVIEWILTI